MHGVFTQFAQDHVRNSGCRKCGVVKRIIANMEKYGCQHISQVKEIRDRQNETIMRTYGVKNISQNEQIKIKKKETTQKNYGFAFYIQSPEGKDRIKTTIKTKYGVEHIFTTSRF